MYEGYKVVYNWYHHMMPDKDRNKGELCLPSSGINEVIDRYFKLIGENNNVSFTI
jgi:hypothetical protein